MTSLLCPYDDCGYRVEVYDHSPDESLSDLCEHFARIHHITNHDDQMTALALAETT